MNCVCVAQINARLYHQCGWFCESVSPHCSFTFPPYPLIFIWGFKGADRLELLYERNWKGVAYYTLFLSLFSFGGAGTCCWHLQTSHSTLCLVLLVLGAFLVLPVLGVHTVTLKWFINIEIMTFELYLWHMTHDGFMVLMEFSIFLSDMWHLRILDAEFMIQKLNNWFLIPMFMLITQFKNLEWKVEWFHFFCLLKTLTSLKNSILQVYLLHSKEKKWLLPCTSYVIHGQEKYFLYWLGKKQEQIICRSFYFLLISY